MKKLICAAVVATGAGWLATVDLSQERPQERVDPAMISAIRAEGLSHAQVMDTVSWLADVYGPRVTGSPGFKTGSRLGGKENGRMGAEQHSRRTVKIRKGWSLVGFSAHMIEPQISPLIGYPKSWTPGTKGTVTGDVVRVDIAPMRIFRSTAENLPARSC